MKKITTEKMGKILKWALIFVFAFGVFFTPFCHWFLREFWDSIFNISAVTYDKEYPFVVVEIYTLGVVMLGIVSQLIRICKRIEAGNPFTVKTTSAFKNMTVFSAALVVVYGIKYIAFPRFTCLLIIFTFIVIGLIAFTLAQLFKKAVEYKEENEFTI